MSHRHGTDEGLHHLADTRVLDDRRRALEEAFFRRQEALQRQRLHEKREREAAREALAGRCGLDDAALLDRLVAAGIRAETVDALVIVPLARVAWADGALDARERAALLRAAHESGVAEGSAGHALLESWTQHPPDPDLVDAWRDYVHALACSLAPEPYRALADRILANARAVAAAAGGFLGIAAVSKAEEAALAEIAAELRVTA